MEEGGSWGAMVAAAPAPCGAAATAVSEVYARDPMIVWFRGEFAAANAIIDELCGHLAQIGGGSDEYEPVFEALHRRRLNWFPVLHMQKFHSVAEVAAELRLVAVNRAAESFSGTADDEPPAAAEEEEEAKQSETENPAAEQDVAQAEEEHAAGDAPDNTSAVDVAIEEEKTAAEEETIPSDSKGVEDGEPNGGSQEEQASEEKIDPLLGHSDVVQRPERIKILKGFVAKESFKGHMVNVLKGLKLYEDIFTDLELMEFTEFINELHLAGQRRELSGDTFILFNKEVKGNKREIIQLGVPLFQSAIEEAANNIEPIPPALQSVIDRLVQWRLLPESRKPNGCIINFFDEDEHSQPYFKPPHLDNPISTIVLTETTMAFGRNLVCDHEGNYKGTLSIPIKQGSLLVMRGNSADMARHVVCSSPNKRAVITLMKVRQNTAHQADSPTSLQSPKSMVVWQPGTPPPSPQKLLAPPATAAVWSPYGLIPAAATTWGLALPSPVVMLTPRRASVASPTKKKSPRSGPGGNGSISGNGGTGVFLPWVVGPKKYNRNLPPRFQKARLLAMPSPLEAQA